MANGKQTGESDPNIITLGVLSAIEENERATQRAISEELGIALGLANAYLKRCVKGIRESSAHSCEPVCLLSDPHRIRRKKQVDRRLPLDVFQFFPFIA